MTTREITLVLGTSTGGVGAHVLSLVEGLTERGWRVQVCGPRATDELFDFSAAGARFVPVQIAGALQDPVASVTLHRVVSGSALLHAHGLRAGTVSALSRARPLVVTWHNAVLGSGLRRRVLAAGERFVARSATLTLAASEDLAGRARELGGRDVRFAPVAAALPHAQRSAADVRAELGIGPERPLIVSVGRLHAQKAHDVLIAAAVRWSAFDPLVVVAGDGPLGESLRAQIALTGAPVRLLGRRADVPSLLGAADVVVLASRWEARSLAAQETLAAGRPLVATRVGGMAGLLGDGAVLVEPDDVEALAASVADLLADPARRDELARRGARQALRWPTLEQTIDQIDAIYRELLGVAR